MFDINAVAHAMSAMADEQKLSIESIDCDLVVEINGLRVGVPIVALEGMTPDRAAAGVIGAWAAQASENKTN